MLKQWSNEDNQTQNLSLNEMHLSSKALQETVMNQPAYFTTQFAYFVSVCEVNN